MSDELKPCDTCFHKEACLAWIRHGEMLYSDFVYSVADCHHYLACKPTRGNGKSDTSAKMLYEKIFKK